MSPRSISFEAIGTTWEIFIYQSIPDAVWARLLERIHQRIAAFDATYSRFRRDSLVTRMSQASGHYELPPDGFAMLSFYESLYQASDGAVTPLIGQVIADAGYDAAYSFKKKPMHRPPRWHDVLAYDEHSITTHQPVLLDFGAAGKGYLVDLVSELIEQASIHSYMINAGGDIRQRAADLPPLIVGLENPLDSTEAIGTVRLSNQSLCASAGSKRKWGKFHHIINPISLQSPTQIIASWVIADDTMTADGLATALFFCDANKLAQQFTFHYATLDKNMRLDYSPLFPVTVFEADT